MRNSSTNRDNRQEIGFIYKFDVLNGVSHFCSVYHLMYDFLQLFCRIYHPCTISCIKKNDTYFNISVICIIFLIHEIVHGTYFDTYSMCIKYFDTDFDTRTDVYQNLWCIKSCIEFSRWCTIRCIKICEGIFFNRKVNFRNAYYSRRYQTNTILEERFSHTILHEKHTIALVTIFCEYYCEILF